MDFKISEYYKIVLRHWPKRIMFKFYLYFIFKYNVQERNIYNMHTRLI